MILHQPQNCAHRAEQSYNNTVMVMTSDGGDVVVAYQYIQRRYEYILKEFHIISSITFKINTVQLISIGKWRCRDIVFRH